MGRINFARKVEDRKLKRELRILNVLEQLASVRLYSVLGKKNGIMVRENNNVYSLVKEARKILKEYRNGHM